MQHFVKQRATENGDITFDTPAIDVSGMPLLTFEAIVYSIAGGGSEQITAGLQTSNDLLTWTSPGVDATVTVAGAQSNAALASDAKYGRYVRFQIAITGSVTSIEYSLILNTFASS